MCVGGGGGVVAIEFMQKYRESFKIIDDRFKIIFIDLIFVSLISEKNPH